MNVRNFIEARGVRSYSSFEKLQMALKLLNRFITFLYFLLLLSLLVSGYLLIKN